MQGYSGKMGSIVYDYLKNKEYNFISLIDETHKIQEEKIAQCDVIIDFSIPFAALNLFKYAIKYHKPIIIGTTGFSKSELNFMEVSSLEAGISAYVVYNFLNSIQKIKELIDDLSTNATSIYLEEKHHKSKLDKPSGTAKYLLKDVNKEVHILSKRLDNFIYEHKIEINNEFESIEITHKCYNKLGYAKGVEKALSNINKFKGVKYYI